MYFKITLLNSILVALETLYKQYSWCKHSNCSSEVNILKLQPCELSVNQCISLQPPAHVLPQVIVAPSLFSDHMEELLGLQQPQKMTAHAL
jgi:hypothetical protein